MSFPTRVRSSQSEGGRSGGGRLCADAATKCGPMRWSRCADRGSEVEQDRSQVGRRLFLGGLWAVGCRQAVLRRTKVKVRVRVRTG